LYRNYYILNHNKPIAPVEVLLTSCCMYGFHWLEYNSVMLLVMQVK